MFRFYLLLRQKFSTVLILRKARAKLSYLVKYLRCLKTMFKQFAVCELLSLKNKDFLYNFWTCYNLSSFSTFILFDSLSRADPISSFFLSIGGISIVPSPATEILRSYVSHKSSIVRHCEACQFKEIRCIYEPCLGGSNGIICYWGGFRDLNQTQWLPSPNKPHIFLQLLQYVKGNTELVQAPGGT